MAFKFKQFSIEDDKCSMKVGTDAVILGAWTKIAHAKNILDIGCGSGIISIMLAQKSDAQICGVEIDEQSALQASKNGEASPWAKQLNILHTSFQSHVQKEVSYDLIVSNPPFFNNSLKSPDQHKTNSKHTVLLSFQELLMGTKKGLSNNGQANFIIPYSALNHFKDLATIEGLFVSHILLIRPKADKEVNRCILSLQHLPSKIKEESLCIRNLDLSYTDDYKSLTSEYYLNF